MREYDGGTASVAELYFPNANNESATRSEEEFVITLTVCCGLTTRCIRVLKNFIKPYIWLKQGHSNARVARTHQ
jgi:hypothetical protein